MHTIQKPLDAIHRQTFYHFAPIKCLYFLYYKIFLVKSHKFTCFTNLGRSDILGAEFGLHFMRR